MLLLFCLIVASAAAQEKLNNLKYNFQLHKKTENQYPAERSSAKIYMNGLLLPFVDDFSYNAVYPDTVLWEDSAVFVNKTFPVDPPTMGVATFDGLNKNGHPYDDKQGAYGAADTLTSKNILMSSYAAADSIYLSFFYQPQGRGDYPNLNDSLVLEFKINDSTWQKMWGIAGPDSTVAQPRFTQVLIAVADNKYFHDEFRFRFINYATLTGNVDHWHLDYVKMDVNRHKEDTLLNDIAYSDPAPSLLSTYREMPWNQFIADPENELVDLLQVRVKSNFNIVIPTFHEFMTRDVNSGAIIDSAGSQKINLQGMEFRQLFYDFSDADVSGVPQAQDSVVFRTRYIVSATGDTRPENDTLTHFQHFYHHFSYDDGSAEKAYELEGTEAQAAYHFYANVPDTLRAVWIHFAPVNDDGTTKNFRIKIWKDIGYLNPGNEQVLYEGEAQSRFSFSEIIDSINGFYSIRIDTSVVVSGDFYIGYQHTGTTKRNLNIGFDLNSNARLQTYFNTGSGWEQSQKDGALMMRPYLGPPLLFAGANDQLSDFGIIKVFPNPATHTATFIIDHPQVQKGPVEIELYDLLGKKVKSETANNRQHEMNCQDLSGGLYIYQVRASGQLIGSGKLIVKD